MDFEIVNLIKYDFSFNLNKLIEYFSLELNIKDSFISIVLCDDDYIKKINNEYRKINQPTDVLSFSMTDVDVFEKEILGEIYISIPMMKKQASDKSLNEKQEFAMLLLHGILHLIGYDHADERDKKAMFSKQERMLKEIEEKGI